ncbi:hypothetical protein [Paludisphaera soli]|uniref:hypothetical protein n=1 Tax=Paludisphaera soli TaxID=2712865 RepID=UPI0013ECAD3A|nr:hypothetical protein [Paludisphaera soli]
MPIQARNAAGKDAEILGDSGLGLDAFRGLVLDELDALPAIPNWGCSKEPCLWHDEVLGTYKRRNGVKRAFANTKLFRRLAAMYKDLKHIYLGEARSVLGFLHVRKLA